jgi:hypothetical protein
VIARELEPCRGIVFVSRANQAAAFDRISVPVVAENQVGSGAAAIEIEIGSATVAGGSASADCDASG